MLTFFAAVTLFSIVTAVISGLALTFAPKLESGPSSEHSLLKGE